MGQVSLKRGKEKPVLLRHPWIFSGAIARVQDAADGDTVDVLDGEGRWLARGYYNSRSQIAVRLWSWKEDEPIDRAFLRGRLERAIAARDSLIDREKTNAYRLVNAESDRLPGLVVDRYGEHLVLQSLALGVEQKKREIVELLAELLDPRGIYERSDADVREKEGLPPSVGVLHRATPPDRLEIVENGRRFLVDCKTGHKTGFYIDQRENRQRVAELLALAPAQRSLREMLNVFAYTGAFGVYGCSADSRIHVVHVDASADALELARENMRLNGFEANGEYSEGDAFQVLRRYRDQARTFDVIVLDPPKFVYAQSQLQAGCRGYKDINLLAIKLLRPGGLLVTFSCSGLVSAELFRQVVFGAAMDAGRDLILLTRLTQAPDHPVLLSFPESEYLKGLVCRLV